MYHFIARSVPCVIQNSVLRLVQLVTNETQLKDNIYSPKLIE